MPTIPISKPIYPANEMKKITYLATICGLILLGLSSCQKENLKGGQFTATIAQMNNDDKVTYDGQGFAWQSGDQIVVYRSLTANGTPSQGHKGTYAASLGEGESSQTATFTFVGPESNVDPNENNSSTNNFDVTDNSRFHGGYFYAYPQNLFHTSNTVTRICLPATQSMTFDANGTGRITGFPMYAVSKSNDRHLRFKNLCGLVKLHLQKANTTVSSINIGTEDGVINGLFNVNLVYNENDELESASLTADDFDPIHVDRNIVSLQFPAQSIANGKDFFIYLPAREYQTLTITITDNNGAVCTKELNSSHTFHVGVSEWSSITLQNDDLVFESVSTDFEGSKGGLFSVAVGKQVVFSQGNLQYNPLQETWRFATNQYDQTLRVGRTDYSSEYTSSYDGWIDLFRWATSGYDEGPCASSTTGSDYGPVIDRRGYPITGDYAEYDWGVHNAISNGGNQAGLWRTLTNNEWAYLLSSRADAANKMAKATVCGKSGLILLPDNWSLPVGMNMTTNNGSYTTSTNVYDATQWQTLEQAGAVFLPITGYLNDSYAANSVNQGYYWSATNSGMTNAYYVNFSGSRLYPGSGRDKIFCHAVRLVHDID